MSQFKAYLRSLGKAHRWTDHQLRSALKAVGKSGFPEVGAVYDNFGQLWQVVRIDKKRREVAIKRDDFDQFGRNIPEHKIVHVSALDTMRRVKAVGTCKPGQRSDLTGCTPASGEGEGKKPSAKPEAKPQPTRQLSGKQIEAITFRRAQEDYPELKAKYLKKNGKFNDKGELTSVVLNTDDWRDLFPEYKGTNSSDVHEAASLLNKKLLAESFKKMRGKGNNTLLILAGGGGSGKSGVGKFMNMEQYPIQLDQVSDNFEKLTNKIKEAQSPENGYDVDYVFVDRPPEDAWLNGVVKRALNSREKGELARTVRIDHAINANIEARKAAISYFKNNPVAKVRVLDNSRGFGMSRMITNRGAAIDHLTKQVYDYKKTERKMLDATMKMYRDGGIPEDIAIGLLGKDRFDKYKNQKPGKKDGPTNRLREKGAHDDAARVHGQREISHQHAGGTEPQRADDVGRIQPRPAGGGNGVGRASVKATKGGVEGAHRKAERWGLRNHLQGGERARGKQSRTKPEAEIEPREMSVQPNAKKEANRGSAQPCTSREPKEMIGKGSCRVGQNPKRDGCVAAQDAPAAKGTEGHEAIKSYLGMIAGVMKNQRPKGFKYSGPQEYVLKNGKGYEAAPLPKGIKHGKLGECYMNAYHLAEDHPELTYVEGFATTHGIPLDHAWCVDKDGKVVDPTWANPKLKPEELEHHYFGVPFKLDFVRKTIMARKKYGVLHNPEQGFPLLKALIVGIQKGKGTCKPGQTAAQTGCTPASGEVESKPDVKPDPELEPKTSAKVGNKDLKRGIYDLPETLEFEGTVYRGHDSAEKVENMEPGQSWTTEKPVASMFAGDDGKVSGKKVKLRLFNTRDYAQIPSRERANELLDAGYDGFITDVSPDMGTIGRESRTR